MRVTISKADIIALPIGSLTIGIGDFTDSETGVASPLTIVVLRDTAGAVLMLPPTPVVRLRAACFYENNTPVMFILAQNALTLYLGTLELGSPVAQNIGTTAPDQTGLLFAGGTELDGSEWMFQVYAARSIHMALEQLKDFSMGQVVTPEAAAAASASVLGRLGVGGIWAVAGGGPEATFALN